jgi:prolyl-tRNA editing enzyme YbaK/EbsC (Cys-tRNA(Pro) deacylase)
MPLDDKDLQRFICERAIAAELVYPKKPTPTVPAAAQALGVAPKNIIKSLVFIANGEPLLVIAAGEAPIDTGRLRETLGVSRRKLKLASPEEALRVSGYEIGAMPPFGHKQVLPTLIDSLSVTEGVLYGGGGTKAAMLKLERATLLEITQGQVLPLTKERL